MWTSLYWLVELIWSKNWSSSLSIARVRYTAVLLPFRRLIPLWGSNFWPSEYGIKFYAPPPSFIMIILAYWLFPVILFQLIFQSLISKGTVISETCGMRWLELALEQNCQICQSPWRSRLSIGFWIHKLDHFLEALVKTS